MTLDMHSQHILLPCVYYRIIVCISWQQLAMDGLQNGMTNGAMKGISRELVAVVRSNSLCPKHNLVLRV